MLPTFTHRSIPDSVHDLEVNSNYCFSFIVKRFFILKISISVANLSIPNHLSVSLLMFRPEEANHFDEDDDEEEEDGPGDEDHDDTMRNIVIFKVKWRCNYRFIIIRGLISTARDCPWLLSSFI